MPRKNRPINPFADPTSDEGARFRKAKAAKRARGQRSDVRVRSDVEAVRPQSRRPELTKDVAFQFVRILGAGIPALDALIYFAPEHFALIDDKQRLDWLTAWSTSPLTVRALNTLNGAAWEDLDKDKRLELALDKTLAGLAYFLYTHDYAMVDGVELKKHDAARKDLMEWLKVRSTGDEDAPWIKAMREIVEGKVHDGKPPVLVTFPAPHSVKPKES